MSDDDKQLTVAELLARAGKDSSSKDKPRRRRRSLEEGGISVAELTGSIPKVKEAPVESRHSAVPMDAPAEQTAQGKPAAKPVEKPVPKATAPAAEPAERATGKPADKSAAKPAGKAPAPKAPAPAVKSADEPQGKPAVKPGEKAAPKATAPATEPAKPVKPGEKATGKPADKPEAKPTGKPQGKPAAKPVEKPVPKATAPAAKPVKPGEKATGKPADKPEAKPTAKPTPPPVAGSPKGPVAAASTTTEKKPPQAGGAETGQSVRAKSPATPAKDLKKTPAPEAGTPENTKGDPAGPATRDTTVLGKVDTDGPARRTPAGAPTLSGPAKTAAASSAMRDSASDAGQTGQMPVVGTDGFDEADAPGVDDRDLIESDDFPEDEQISMGAVLLMSVVGIVLGILVFLGFDLLWGRFSSVIVGLLALAVTGVMVAVVHALRTSRDGLSMVLAGVVGLVMTFGPLAIMVL